MKPLLLIVAAGFLVVGSGTVLADTGHDGAKTGEHHRTVHGIVTAEKSGVLTVRTPDGRRCQSQKQLPNDIVIRYRRSARR
jgi:hypothetical protein